MNHWNKGLLFIFGTMFLVLSFFGIYNYLHLNAPKKATGLGLIVVSTVMCLGDIYLYKKGIVSGPLKFQWVSIKKNPKDARNFLIFWTILYISLIFVGIKLIL